MLRLKSPLDVAIVSTLWILANPDTFRSTALQFGSSRSVVYLHYAYIVMALRELAPRFVKWPNPAERDVIKWRFEEKSEYPGVIGCIDGTHINITAPFHQPQGYVNGHHDYSILVQAVSDDRLLMMEVFVGQPGSVGDARMFSRSPLSQNLALRPELIADDEHLLGDGAYLLTKTVIVPYEDDGVLTNCQRKHNKSLCKARVAVERGFGRLKGLFRRLKYFPCYSIGIAIDHIMACIMLHNFIILQGEEPEAFDGEHIYAHGGGRNNVVLEAAARNEGIFKREYIAGLLTPEE